MKLACQAIDRSGRTVTQTIEACDQMEATEMLRARGLYVTSVSAEAGEDTAVKAGLSHRRIGGMRRLKYLVSLSRQLYVLTSTGTPMLQALEAVQRQTADVRWKAVLADVSDQIEQGKPLSEAMRSHGDYFDPVYSSIIAAGESSGQLNVMLNRLAMLTSKQLHLRRSISGAMIYPALLMNVGVIVMTVLLVFVLPRFAGMFKSLDAPLPPTTRFMMFLSDVVRGYWWAVLAVIGACGFGVWQYVHSAAGRRTIGNTLLTLPRFGKIAKELIAARIVRLLGVLLDSNVPVLDALALTRDAAGNEKFAQLVADAEDAVSRGDNISSAFDHSNLINPSICEAIRNGERSGQIGPLLLNIADFMDEENEVVVRSLSSLIEPLILIVLGVFVGFVAISMFMPLFDLTAMGGGP